MKYLFTVAFLFMLSTMGRSQNEDMPFCVIPQEVILKHKIVRLTIEDKVYKLGLCRKKNSYRIVHTFDTLGRIIQQEWISIRTQKRDHLNLYRYDPFGNLIKREIAMNAVVLKYDYFFRYDSSGRIDQYYTEPRKKLLFRYEGGRLKAKLKITPTDTLETWNYNDSNGHLIQETYTTKGLPTQFVTQYVYAGDALSREIHLINSDTVYTVVFTYNAFGNKISEVQTHKMKGNEKTWSYSNSGQLESYQSRSGNEVETKAYFYTEDGMLFETKRKSSVEWGITEKSKMYYTFNP